MDNTNSYLDFVISEIVNAYESEKNISTFIPTGLGVNMTIRRLLTKIEGKVLILFATNQQIKQFNHCTTDKKDSAKIVIVNDIIQPINTGDYDLVILFQLPEDALSHVQTNMNNTDVRTLSVLDRPSEILFNKKYNLYDNLFWGWVGHTGIIDVRLLNSLPAEKQITSSKRKPEMKNLKITIPGDVAGYKFVSKLFSTEERVYIGQPSKSQIKRIAEENEQKQIWMKMLLYWAEQDYKNSEVIDAQNDTIKELQTDSFIHKTIISNMGISQESLNSLFSKIESLKQEYKKSLISGNDDEIENISEEIQTRICELFTDILKDTDIPKEECEKEIIQLITPAIWNLLKQKSKDYLITALFTYKSMYNQPSFTSFDYSGVCLLLSTVVDIEMHERFRVKYIEYLKQRGIDKINWPDQLRLNDNKFTLGSIKYTIENNRPLATNFAVDILYGNSLERTEVKQKLSSIVAIVEYIRTAFRNPAAHRDGLYHTSAEKCFEYTLFIQKKLKELLEGMSI